MRQNISIFLSLSFCLLNCLPVCLFVCFLFSLLWTVFLLVENSVKIMKIIKERKKSPETFLLFTFRHLKFCFPCTLIFNFLTQAANPPSPPPPSHDQGILHNYNKISRIYDPNLVAATLSTNMSTKLLPDSAAEARAGSMGTLPTGHLALQ